VTSVVALDPTTDRPPGYPRARECDVVASDGGMVHVRAIRPDDAERLVAFHDGLSSETVYRRFFSVRPHLTEADVERFTRVDYHDRLALVVLLGDVLVAVGRFDRLVGSTEAEVAFVVADAHQGRGLGTLLLEHLAAAARPLGIAHFVADTLATNGPMLNVFHDAGFEEHRTFDQGVVQVRFAIGPTAAYQSAVDERDRRAQAASIGRLLQPRSIAVVGAGRTAGTIGHEILANLIKGGFSGGLYPVNPGAAEILGLRCFPSLAALADDVDLVVIAVPAPAVPAVIVEAGAHHACGVVVVSAGFAETGATGARAEDELVRLARANGLRVIGPNCLGILNADPGVSMNATFSPAAPTLGRAAFMSQSGALGIAVLDRARQQGLGISTFVSAGNKADVSGNDLLQYWEADPRTAVVLLYLESFGNPRKFARVARRVSRSKPIIAVKSGRSGAGERAARSHTASAATDDVAVDALFRQAGVVRVDTLSELLDTAALLANQPLPRGPRVAIVGNSGGPGILAADACVVAGLEVPELAPATRAALREALPGQASVGNPVDLVASASGADYERALGVVLADDDIDAVIAVFTPTLVTEPDDVARAVAKVAKVGGLAGTKPVLATFLTFAEPPAGLSSAGVPAGAVPAGAVPAGVRDPGEAASGAGSPDDGVAGGGGAVPWYPFPELAVAALARAWRYAQWRASPVGVRPVLEGIDVVSASALIAGALDARPEGGWLAPEETSRLLAAYGVETIPTHEVRSAAEAARAAQAIGFPVVLKAMGPTLVHKSDIGGVQLDIRSAAQASRAYQAMAGSIGDAMTGAIVQPMAAPGVETIIGVVQDPSFGPLLMFGLGGVATDLLGDRAFRLLPLTDLDAAELIASVKSAPLLTGYRGSPPTDVAALSDLLMRVARMAEAHPDLAEADLNPVIVSPSGVRPVDVRIRLSPAVVPPDPTERRLR
jgi:acetyl coenzyme A synthetase (ADP forming)-like protein